METYTQKSVKVETKSKTSLKSHQEVNMKHCLSPVCIFNMVTPHELMIK